MSKKTAVVNAAALYFSDRLKRHLAAVPATPLTLVEAPMGYGKTVAIRAFLAGAAIRSVWVPVLGDSATAFWGDFCRTLGNAFPDQADLAESLLRLGHPHDSAVIQEARALLLQVSSDHPFVLAVDDCHLLPDKARIGFETLCEQMARSGPLAPRLVLITRGPYAGNREVLELKGVLRRIGQELLALAPAEIRSYYAKCGVPIGSDEARRLYSETGGWFGALYLYLLRCIKEGELVRSESVDALVGKELYEPLSEPLKQLLFDLAPLERFTREQADHLHGRDTRELLTELRRKNSFVAYDPTDGIYTPHAIFRQFLAERFARLPDERREAVHRACGEWFLWQGDKGRAIDAFYAAGDFESALSVLESDLSQNWVTEKAGFFVELFRACPESILDRHLPAAFKYALAAFSAADFQTFGRQCAYLAKKCAGLPQGDKTADAWRGELEFLRSLAAFNDIEAMSAHHRRAFALLRGTTRLFGPESHWALGSPSVLFMFYRESGKLAEAVRQMHECLPHYYLLAAHHGAGGEFLLEAEALFDAGRFEQAEILCHKAQAMAERNRQLGNVICALFLRMRLELAAGGFEPACLLVEAMRALIRKSRDYFLLHTVDLCEGWLHALIGPAAIAPGPGSAEAAGTSSALPSWLRNEPAEDHRLYAFARGVYYIVHGRLLLLEGRHARVLGLFGYILESDAFQKNLLFAIYARIYMAAALQALGNPQDAAEELRNALDTAVPDELYMPFVENFDLLQPIPEQWPEPIQRLAGAWERTRNGIVARCFPDHCLPLTKRELQLAGLAAEGKKYAEIAAQLQLAPTTVKKAFVVIYKKLGISSREELRDYLAARGLGPADLPTSPR